LNVMSPTVRYVAVCAVGAALPVAGVLSAMGVPERAHHTPIVLTGWLSIPALVACFNLWISYGRALVWKHRHGSLAEFRHVSGFPVIGSVATAAAAGATWGDVVSGMMAVVLSFLDTGSLTWFAIQCVRHRLLDAPVPPRAG
jgi:hypothetical protein